MRKEAVLLNANILSLGLSDLLKEMNSGVMITPNVDHLVRLQKDEEFYNCYKSADWVICDSKILYLVSKLTRNKIKEAIPGSSFFPSYYNYHKNNNEVKVFLLGAAPGIAVKAMNAINEKTGSKIIVGAHSPSYGFEKDEKECKEIINIINSSEANVLVVGVGAPKQEKWIYKYRYSLKKINLFMGLGATIDFESGNVKRAPNVFQKLGIEWFYRLLQEPRRLSKRYFKDLLFFYFFTKQLLGLYKNPFK